MRGRYDGRDMQSPMLVFDHFAKQVITLPTGRKADRRLDEILATQRKQIMTSGRPPK